MDAATLKDFLTPMVGLASAVVGLATAIVGITKYFNYRSRQDELRLVKQSFDAVVTSLRSDSSIERLAGAILLRRFYDSHTEMGTGGAPYWKVAVDVSAAILRGLTTGDFQKLLADGLAFAPTLIRADLQRTNLQFGYLGSRKLNAGATKEITTDLRYADFYRADLSRASLKRANAEGAVFYQARLHNTVLSETNLTAANFFDADIKGAIFDGAILYKANFNSTRNIPVEFGDKLDENGIYQDQKPFQRVHTTTEHPQIAVFVSKPGCPNTLQKQQIDFVEMRLRSQGIIPKTLEREDYPSFGAIGEVRRVMSGCAGAIVFGFSDLSVHNGTWRATTSEETSVTGVSLSTPWAHIEAGMAMMAGLPVLIVHQRGVDGGIFGIGENENSLYYICIDDNWDNASSVNAFANWSADAREQSRRFWVDDLSAMKICQSVQPTSS